MRCAAGSVWLHWALDLAERRWPLIIIGPFNETATILVSNDHYLGEPPNYIYIYNQGFMNHVVLTLFIDHVHPIWTIEVLGGLLMTFWQSVAACSLLFVFASQSWQFLSQNKWLANNFKVEACWSAHIITITSLCIYLLVRPIFLFAERRGVPPWILGSFWMLLTLSLSMSFQKVYFFVCLFVCLMRLHLGGIDILTRALSWLLGPGMQGLPGRAQAILMGAGETLGTSFSTSRFS